MFRVILVSMAVSALALVGCRRGDLSINWEAGTINVTLSESDVNAAIAQTIRVLELSSLTVSDTGIEFALKRAK